LFNIVILTRSPTLSTKKIYSLDVLASNHDTYVLYAYPFIENFRKQSNKRVFVGPDSFRIFEQVQIYRICDHFKHVNKCISI